MAIDTRDTVPPDTTMPPPAPARSRRAVLTAALGGLGGLIVARLGAPGAAEAAAGSPLIIGNVANNAGTANTTLTTASTGTALLVTQNGTGTALRGSAVGAGSIAGFFTAANGTGISGVTASPNTYGVYGANDGAAGTGAAVRARGINNDGLVTTTNSAGKVALRAVNSAVDGTVALFQNTSGGTGGSAGPAIRAYTGGGSDADVHPAGGPSDAAGEFAGPVGVTGVSVANSYGVQGISFDGPGVYGVASGGYGVRGVSGNNTGVFGSATQGVGAHGDSVSNFGVLGTSGNSVGVLGSSGSGVGVYGYGGGGSAGFFEGLLSAYSVNAAIKAFRIDHPLDPANKVLEHSCVESNERLTVYAGTVTTDARGEAVIALPAYFDALNTDLRYQLTPLADARAWVKRKVTRGRFTISTSEPGTEVCWQVTGVRQDAFAKAHPLVAEAAKTGREKGKYLHPVEHGKPESAGVASELRQAMGADGKPAA